MDCTKNIFGPKFIRFVVNLEQVSCKVIASKMDNIKSNKQRSQRDIYGPLIKSS